MGLQNCLRAAAQFPRSPSPSQLLGLSTSAQSPYCSGLGWLHAKLLVVVLLSGYHGWAVGYARKLAAGRPTLTPKQLRLANELPALAAIAAVVLAVVKPF